MAYTSDEWWAKDHPAGKRVGWMLPWEFMDTVTKLFGGTKSTQAPLLLFAQWAGVGKSTVYRWANGDDPTPKWAATLLALELKLYHLNKAGTVINAYWLPYSDGANGRQRPVDQPPDGDTAERIDNHKASILADRRRYGAAL